MIAAPESPWVIPAPGTGAGQQAHVLVGRSDKLGAEHGLHRRWAASSAREPALEQLERGRERPAVETVDHLHQPVLVVTIDGAAQLAKPGALPVARVPCHHG